MELLGNRASWIVEKQYNSLANFTDIVYMLISNTTVLFEITETNDEWIIMFNGGH